MSRDGTVKHVLARGSSDFFLQHFDLLVSCILLTRPALVKQRKSIYNKPEVLCIMTHIETRTVESKILRSLLLFL